MKPTVVLRIAAKELALVFSSPIAYLFLAAFLGATLFVFFWGEAFFARNISDVRPMFESLPILLIFLASALTMRMWSDERRTGTLELVVTVPANAYEFVVGKFVACWTLLLGRAAAHAAVAGYRRDAGRPGLGSRCSPATWRPRLLRCGVSQHRAVALRADREPDRSP